MPWAATEGEKGGGVHLVTNRTAILSNQETDGKIDFNNSRRSRIIINDDFKFNATAIRQLQRIDSSYVRFLGISDRELFRFFVLTDSAFAARPAKRARSPRISDSAASSRIPFD